MPASLNQPLNSVCLLTPAGPGAVAVLQLELAEPEQAAHFLAGFRSGSASSVAAAHEAPVNRILFGQWSGEDVLLVRTAPCRWELHCHGGAVAVRRILLDLEQAGLPTVPALGDASTPLSQSLSVPMLIEIAVQRALTQCRTRLAADWILRQLDGRLLEPVTQLRSPDPRIRSHARAQLFRHAPFLKLLLRPARVGLFGPPNAGKSSLLNALCGLSRAIVSPVAGTTRDPVDAETQVHGRMLCITDTAGLHDAPGSPLEADGIRRTQSLVSHCDAACILAPADQPLPDIRLLTEPFRSCPATILVRSRCDLLQTARHAGNGLGHPHSTDTLNQSPGFLREVFVSAVTGEGLDELRNVLLQVIFPPEPEPDTALPLSGLTD